MHLPSKKYTIEVTQETGSEANFGFRSALMFSCLIFSFKTISCCTCCTLYCCKAIRTLHRLLHLKLTLLVSVYYIRIIRNCYFKVKNINKKTSLLKKVYVIQGACTLILFVALAGNSWILISVQQSSLKLNIADTGYFRTPACNIFRCGRNHLTLNSYLLTSSHFEAIYKFPFWFITTPSSDKIKKHIS